MSETNTIKTNVFCINSVKGGAGKTTVALTLACSLLTDLESQYKNKLRNMPPKICYLDFDILGTGSKHFIYGNNLPAYEIKYFNEVMENNICVDKFINEISLQDKESKLHCILMNDDPKEKARFIKGARLHTSQVNINVFEQKAVSVLIKIINECDYDYIIIDCSPSYESSAQNIYSQLIKEINNKNKKVNKVYNLFVTTLDNAHLMNTISSVCNIINATENCDNIKIILNDTLGNFEDEHNSENDKFLKLKKEEFIDEIFEKIKSLRKEELTKAKDLHEPSNTSFNKDSIIVKKYSDIANLSIWKHSKQLNGTTVWKSIDDNELIKTLK